MVDSVIFNNIFIYIFYGFILFFKHNSILSLPEIFNEITSIRIICIIFQTLNVKNLRLQILTVQKSLTYYLIYCELCLPGYGQ